MKLIIIRGGPSTGKSAVAKALRDKIPGSVHVHIDLFKGFFKNYFRKKSPRRERELLYKAVREVVRFFLGEGYSVIVEGLFIETKWIDWMAD
ncbi:MAG: zeta toxin family protein, partial [Candidatus Aerophobetes bacterium]|nr:zeta toxin family protein [Candidatus Aerophobetes bacterium]